MANADIASIIQVVTRDYRGKVRTASAQVRAFENMLKDLNKVPGVHVRIPAQGASLAMTAASNITGVVKEGLDHELREIFDESQFLVPVDTGKLKASGEVQEARRRGDTLYGSVRYGQADEDVDYALYVHERVDQMHAAPTQAKFLEQAMVSQLPGMEDRLAKAVATYLGSL